MSRWAAECGGAEQGPDLAHRQVGAPVGRDQQDTVRQLQAPGPAPTAVRDLRTTAFGHDSNEFAGD
jgi:hypothetical protein